MTEIAPNIDQHWRTKRRSIGREGNTVLVIDNFFPDPDILMKDASVRSYSALAPYYPGIRAKVPGKYIHMLEPALTKVLATAFGFNDGFNLKECFYSLLTTQVKDLKLIQSLPHVDGGNDKRVALLHYLCDESFGGTSFYRHRRTGFESVPNDRFPTYKAALEKDVEIFGRPKQQYFSGDDEKFERIGHVEAKFNRAVIYFGRNLHAIDIGKDFTFNQRPTEGRLTINSFLDPV
ncbi:MAG: hypothetical protein JKX72_12295 [Robiginitomaculum sp.]|nr:hypothetical protein [Robiginitomaculum sp.]